MKLSEFFSDPKPKRRGRGPTRAGHDQLALEEARYLRELRKRDPDKWQALMEHRIAVRGWGPSDYAQGAPEKSTLETVVSALAVALGPALLGVMTGGGMGQMAPPPPRTSVEPPPQAPPQLALDQVAGAPIGPREPVQFRGPRSNAQPPLTVSIDPAARMVITMLAEKTAAEAAETLAGTQHIGIQNLVSQLVRTAPEMLPVLLADVATAEPRLAAVITWLEPQMPWVVLVQAELRARLGVESDPGA